MPQLRITQDPGADELLGRDPLALLIGMLLDQQFPMARAFAGPLLLAQRMGADRLDAGAVAAADPRFLPFVASASAQTATAVLVTAILAPLVASWVLRRAGGLTVHDPVPEIAASKADPEVQLAG